VTVRPPFHIGAAFICADLGIRPETGDDHAAYTLKRAGELDKSVQHRQVKYLNNRLEADHGALKRLINPTCGFKTLPTASATVKGFEVMRIIRKRQSSCSNPEQWEKCAL
jgi:transposase-like protein